MNLPSAKEMITALAIMQGDGVNMPMGVLWFLFVLFVYLLVTYFFIKIVKINAYGILVLSIILLFVAHFFKDNYYFAMNKITPFYFYFIVGYILSDSITTGRIFTNNLIIVYFIFFSIPLYIEHHASNTYIVWSMERTGIRSLAGSLFLTGLCYKIQHVLNDAKITKYLRYCGVNSIIIYVFHTPTMFVMHKFLSHTSLAHSLSEFLLIVLTGCLFPVIYGKVLSYHPVSYRLLLGRDP